MNEPNEAKWHKNVFQENCTTCLLLLHVSTVNYNHLQGVTSVEDLYSVLYLLSKNKLQNIYTNMCHSITFSIIKIVLTFTTEVKYKNYAKYCCSIWRKGVLSPVYNRPVIQV